ncbi:MAG: hypothetical protein HZA53_06295 [Planctomycetes bacterium]|nr:hypothetical protein [Planctomycetota bacterium]
MTERSDSEPTNEPRRVDPLLDDVRAARRRVWEDAGGTFEGLLARLEVIQREYGAMVVRDAGGPQYGSDTRPRPSGSNDARPRP